MIVFKPYYIFELLNFIKGTSNLTTKMEIIEKIQWILSRLHINSYIISKKSILKEDKSEQTLSFMNELIDIIITNNRESTLIESCLNLISIIGYHCGIKVKFYKKVLQKMYLMFTGEILYDGNTFLLLLKIMNQFLIKSLQDGRSFPEKFFFFNNYMSEIKVNSDDLQFKNIPINKGYTIGMWIYLEKITPDTSNKKITENSSLFYIHTNKYHVFEAYLKQNSIYYKSFNNSLEEKESNEIEEPTIDIYLTDIEYNKWTFLVFTHKSFSFLQKPSIILYKNNKEPIVKLFDYPNLNNQKISSIGICKDFSGLLSNVFMINDSLSQPNIINDLVQYSFGLYNEENIRIFKNYIEKNDSLPSTSTNSKNNTNELKIFFDNLIFMYSPCRFRDGVCYDLVDNINAEISTYSEGNLAGGVFNDNNTYIFAVNGVSIFLPIFEFIFNSKYGTPVVLEESLKLLLNVFGRKEYFDDDQAKKNDKNFFSILQHIMKKYEVNVCSNYNLFTKEILDMLINLSKILLKNVEQYYDNVRGFFRGIIFNPMIINKFDSNLQIELWNKIENLYKNSMSTMNTFFDATDIIELIIILYDSNINKYCCENHFKMLNENEKEAEKMIQSPSFKVKTANLISITRHILTNSNFITINQIIKIIPYLSSEICPCLQIEILSIFSDVFNIEILGSQFMLVSGYIDSFLKNGGIEHLLYLISISTLDVRFQCMKIFEKLIMNSVDFPYDVHEFVSYVTTIFFPIKTKDKLTDSQITKKKHKRVQNSIIAVEENYWNQITSTDLITKLSIPIEYIQNHENELNDEVINQMYEFMIKWLVNKLDVQDGQILDDSDELAFEPALYFLMQLVMYSNMMLKQKFLTNLYTLVQFNKGNCNKILRNKYFYHWLLDLLFPCQLLKATNSNDKSGLCETILSQGMKLHTCIIVNSILLEQEIEKELRISRSFYGENQKANENHLKTKIDHQTIFNSLLEWMYKIRSIGQNEGKNANNFVRALFLNLINELRQHLKQYNYSNHSSPVWNSFLSLTLAVYQFAVMSNFDKKIKEETLDIIEKNEIIGEVIQNLNFDYSKSDKIQNQTPIIELWEDKILLVALYNSFKEIWNDSFFIIDKSSSFLQDQTKSISHLLQKKIFDEAPNAYINELSLLLYGSADSHNIMRCILNTIMLIIRLSESKDDISEWIKELEKFILFLIISSEKMDTVSGTVNSAFLNNARECVAEAFVLTFNFLIEEMNSPRREERISNEILNEFKSCIRTLFISFAFAIEQILIYEKNKNSQTKIETFLSFLTTLKNTLLMQQNQGYSYSPLYKVYNEIFLTKQNTKIFDLKDINEYKLNNFIEIPQKFKYENFIYAFQENLLVNKILKNHFCFFFFKDEIQTRLFKANQIIINGDICGREKDIIDKIQGQIKKKIKVSLDTIYKKREKEAYLSVLNDKKIEIKWKKYKKENCTWRGKWINFNYFLHKVKEKKIKFKVANHYSDSLYCPLLYNIYEIQKYLPKFSKFKAENIFIFESSINKEQQHTDQEKDNNNLSSSEEKNTKKKFLHFLEFTINYKTKKGNLFKSNEKFSGFFENYQKIEKIQKYFSKKLKNKAKLCLIELSKCYISKIKEQNPNIKHYTNVCRLKLTSHAQGEVLLSQKNFYFVINYPPKEKSNKCNGELFQYDYSKERKLVYIIPISKIKYVFKRRYYYKKTSLEIFTTSNKSFYFIFNTQNERDEVLKIIDINNTSLQLDNLVKDWVQWNKSSFDLLNFINSFGGRSFKDLTQYPVFPWIISDNQSETLTKFSTKTIRDLSKPIGALGSPTRTENFKMKFTESEDDNDDNAEGRCFFSSHYSNPFYVTHYLYRIFPFSACAIELQGGGFDQPSRQFLSIPSSFDNCMNESTDIREIIPEFFFLPEMFHNINNINFGSGTKETCVMPEWAKNKPFCYVLKNRVALESNYTSSQINNWIDLIFGYKQKGKEAINSINLFFKFTYEDEINIDKIIESDEYDSLISKIDFGQTPSQIFTKPFSKRNDRNKGKSGQILLETKNSLLTYNSTSEHFNSDTKKSCRKDIASKMIIYIKTLQNDKVFVVYNNGIAVILKATDTPYSESGLILIQDKKIYLPSDYNDKENIYNSKVGIVDEDSSIMKTIDSNQPVLVIKKGKYIIKGGYCDSKFLLFQTDEINKYIYIQLDKKGKANAIITDSLEKMLFIGTTNGKVFIYEISDNGKILENFLKLKKILNHHDNSINSMYICNRLNVFATISKDKTCNLYSYPRMKMYYVIKEEDNVSFDYVFISASPLPSLILYSKHKLMFYIYTINGSFLKKIPNRNKILLTPKITYDNYYRDYLVFGTVDGNLCFIRLPLMEKSFSFELKNTCNGVYYPIKCFDFTEDRQNIYFWQLDNFNISVLKNGKQKKDINKAQKKITIFDGELNI